MSDTLRMLWNTFPIFVITIWQSLCVFPDLLSLLRKLPKAIDKIGFSKRLCSNFATNELQAE